MADASGIDVLMRIVPVANGAAMEAENQTAFTLASPPDPLLKDFVTGQCCDLQEFNFKAGLESKLDKKDEATASELSGASASYGTHLFERDRAISLRRSRLESAERRSRGDAVDMQPVGYTRILDSASTLLFKALAECTTLASVSIVKRKAAGTPSGGQGFLRLDFSNVLITSLDWKDGEHVMIETAEFIYRSLTIQYRPQKPDGTLDVAVSATWQMKATRTGT